MTLTPAQIASAVYQACTTYDQYLPQLSPDVAKSWSKVFVYSQLDADDLLAGVDRVYRDQGHGYRPMPSDIARAGRQVREDRSARESNEAREERQTALERKAAEDAVAVSVAFELGPVKVRTKRLAAAEDGLLDCYGRQESMAAMNEYFAAKREANKAAQ